MASSENLSFSNTNGLKPFLISKGATKINLVKNPKTDKVFFTTDVAGISGKVSDKVKKLSAELQVSACTDNDNPEETFLMLHTANDANVFDSFTL